MARLGGTNVELFRVAVMASTRRRDAQGIENVGIVNMRPNPASLRTIQLNSERVRFWLGRGAEPTKHVRELLEMVGLMPPMPAELVDRVRVPDERRHLQDAPLPDKQFT